MHTYLFALHIYTYIGENYRHFIRGKPLPTPAQPLPTPCRAKTDSTDQVLVESDLAKIEAPQNDADDLDDQDRELLADLEAEAAPKAVCALPREDIISAYALHACV